MTENGNNDVVSSTTSTTTMSTNDGLQPQPTSKTTVVQVNPNNSVFTPYQPLIDALQAGAWAIVLFMAAVGYLARGRVIDYFKAMSDNLKDLVRLTVENKEANVKTSQALEQLEDAIKHLEDTNIKNGKVLRAVYQIGMMFKNRADDEDKQDHK